MADSWANFELNVSCPQQKKRVNVLAKVGAHAAGSIGVYYAINGVQSVQNSVLYGTDEVCRLVLEVDVTIGSDFYVWLAASPSSGSRSYAAVEGAGCDAPNLNDYCSTGAPYNQCYSTLIVDDTTISLTAYVQSGQFQSCSI